MQYRLFALLMVGVAVTAALLGALLAGASNVEIDLEPIGFSTPDESETRQAQAKRPQITPLATRRDRGLFKDWARKNLSGVNDLQLVSMREVRATPPRRLRVSFRCESILGGTMSNHWVFEEHEGRLIKQN